MVAGVGGWLVAGELGKADFFGWCSGSGVANGKLVTWLRIWNQAL